MSVWVTKLTTYSPVLVQDEIFVSQHVRITTEGNEIWSASRQDSLRDRSSWESIYGYYLVPVRGTCFVPFSRRYDFKQLNDEIDSPSPLCSSCRYILVGEITTRSVTPSDLSLDRALAQAREKETVDQQQPGW
eukprot:scpid84465/ scgid23732/ 